MGDATGSARVHAKWVAGYQVFYTTHANRWLKAVGPSTNHFEMTRAMPLVGAAGVDTYWGTGTIVETSANATYIAAVNTAGVAARIVTDNQEYDGVNLQASGAAFNLTASMPFYFGIKVAINHATSTDLYVGLCETRTELLRASTAHTLHASTKNHAGFYKYDAVTATKYIAEDSGSASSSSAGTMDTSAHIYEMYWDGSTLNYYVDGSAVGTVTAAANLTASAMRPSLCFRTGSNNARQCDIYWWRAIQVGQ